MVQTFLFRDFSSAEMLGTNGKPEEEGGEDKKYARYNARFALNLPTAADNEERIDCRVKNRPISARALDACVELQKIQRHQHHDRTTSLSP